MFRSSLVAGAMLLPALLLLGYAAEKPEAPLGLPPLFWPRTNPYSAEKVELGRDLYFDPRLSADGTISCATCHDPRHAFTDPPRSRLGSAARRAPAALLPSSTAPTLWRSSGMDG
jgi:cytochrome c peroxidase